MTDIDDLRANPGAGWTVADIEVAAQGKGCQVTVHGKSLFISHVTVRPIYTVRAKNPVRAVKITEFLDWIDLIGGP